jgi:hypothetical protein
MLEFSPQSLKNPQVSEFMKVLPVGADGQTDRYDKSNIPFQQFLRKRLKIKKSKINESHENPILLFVAECRLNLKNLYISFSWKTKLYYYEYRRYS